MELGFRWYGTEDSITLNHIRQIPNLKQIVSAIYNVPVGEIWPLEEIQRLETAVKKKSLAFEVIESVPVHEEIKLGGQKKDYWISNFQETLKNLGKCGIKTVCYNFMPVFDWTRTNLSFQHQDGSNSLSFSWEQLPEVNSLDSLPSLPGWDLSYQQEELHELFRRYQEVDEEKLWENLSYFLKKIIPAAKEAGIKMAIHPDDPPFSIFGLPRIITDDKAYKRLFDIDSSVENGITFCTGSLAANSKNDIYKMLDSYLKLGKVHFMHARNIQLHENGDFEETAHASNYGSIDMVRVIELLKKHQFTGCIRPDHGRMIFGETGRPGYGLYDRALGASYIYGIWETLNK
ncbi:mannonate dehydratase [Vagococcus elongatus]|uniref:Mannonate dehydratase n=1 Tax=Vagococcus elongatus TaxID=180344 RepID=A0A430AN35_9ENTE|nr:mannonate dehydratase [Vagococcus elongatus]RSU09570.1 mannonate dehydratase [Vagococcus elongatus]